MSKKDFSDAATKAIQSGDTRPLKEFAKAADEEINNLRSRMASRCEKAAQGKEAEGEAKGQVGKEAATESRAERRRQARRRKGDGGVYRRGRIYWITYWVNGEKVFESSHSDKESVARTLLRKRLGEVAEGRSAVGAEKITVAELADDVVTDYQINNRDTVSKAKRSAMRIKEFFGNAKAHNVKGEIQGYIAERKERGASNGLINRELSFLRRAFILGIRAGKITRRPYIAMLKEDNVRTGFFEYPEFLAVRAAAPDWFKPVITFAYFTAWREKEILRLRWNQVDLQAEEIRLNRGDTKNEEGRVIMLDGELLDPLREQWERRKVVNLPGQAPALLCPYVFHRNGRMIGGKYCEIRDYWRAAAIAAGLGKMVEVERGGKAVSVYRGKYFHDLRRTGVREMVRAGIPERVAIMISGHKTRSVFERYNIVSQNDLREAARRRSAHAEEQAERTKKVVKMGRDRGYRLQIGYSEPCHGNSGHATLE